MQAPHVWRGRSGLLELPDEILEKIAALLSIYDRYCFRKTCRRSRRVANMSVESAKVRKAAVYAPLYANMRPRCTARMKYLRKFLNVV